jgi:hypothetical protein
MLLTVSEQITINPLSKWVSAKICIFSCIYGFVRIVNTNVIVETCARTETYDFKDNVKWEGSVKLCWIMLTAKTWSTWSTTCPSVTLSTTNSTWIGLALNLGLCSKWLQSNQLTVYVDVNLSDVIVIDININVVSQYCNILLVITLQSLIWPNVAVENIESNNFTALLQ